jgi:hypothetical protein
VRSSIAGVGEAKTDALSGSVATGRKVGEAAATHSTKLLSDAHADLAVLHSRDAELRCNYKQPRDREAVRPDWGHSARRSAKTLEQCPVSTASKRRIRWLIVFSFVLLLCTSLPNVSGAVDQATIPTDNNLSCSLRHGTLIAYFQKDAALPPIFSTVFDVHDRQGHSVLTEIVPAIGQSSLLAVFDEPLDVAHIMKRASTVSCYTTTLFGSITIAFNPLCSGPVPVDMGISLTPRALEIVGNRAYVEVTAAQAMLGAIQIRSFHGERLYLRGADGGARSASSLQISGPNPQTVRMAMKMARADRVLELGVDNGTPLVGICLKRQNT